VGSSSAELSLAESSTAESSAALMVTVLADISFSTQIWGQCNDHSVFSEILHDICTSFTGSDFYAKSRIQTSFKARNLKNTLLYINWR
jgi:hypothetical protein